MVIDKKNQFNRMIFAINGECNCLKVKNQIIGKNT